MKLKPTVPNLNNILLLTLIKSEWNFLTGRHPETQVSSIL